MKREEYISDEAVVKRVNEAVRVAQFRTHAMLLVCTYAGMR